MRHLHCNLSDNVFLNAIRNTGESDISVFISNQKNDEFNDYFHLHPEPIYSNIYIRENKYEEIYKKLFNIDIVKSSSPFPMKIIYYKNDFRLFVHTPGTVVVPFSGSEAIFKVKFGIGEDASNCTDRVEFVLTHVGVDGFKTELLKYYVDSLADMEDRAIQERNIKLNKLGKGYLLLQTYPGKSNDCDWAFWSNMELL